MVEKLNIAIVGFGPIGGIFGTYLRNAGQNVVPVDILKDHLDKVKADGLKLTGFVEKSAKFEDLCYNIKDLKDKKMDFIAISVKAVNLPIILKLLKEVHKPGTFYISLQNGLDTEIDIAETFGKENVARIVVNYAGNLIDNGLVRMSFFNKPNYIGVLDPGAEPKARQIAEVMTGADLETEFSDEIRKHVWEKVILNSGLSPVCALTRKTMKEMMDHEDIEFIVTEVLKEGIKVAEATGIKYDEDFLEHCLGYLKKAGYHQTSMHVDIENKRRTEISYLNEKIVIHGREHGVPTPYNTCITALIKGLEMKDHRPK